MNSNTNTVRVCSWCQPPRLMNGGRATLRATKAEQRRATHACCDTCMARLGAGRGKDMQHVNGLTLEVSQMQNATGGNLSTKALTARGYFTASQGDTNA